MAHTATTFFRTSRETKDRVMNLAKQTNRSVGFYMNLLLDEYLDDLEDMYLSKKIVDDIQNGTEETIPADTLYKELGI